MSIFRSIKDGIFGRASAHSPTAAPPKPADAPQGAEEPGTGPLSAAPDSAPDAPGHTAADQPVDVVAVLSQLEAKSGQSLNWRQSIVDLMELIGIDSGLAARKELARELGYTGSTDDSVAMNVWLHKQVMAKLAENGGKVPDDLQ